ncbi:hypothetical protein SDC9_22939 [bioreactor metagenome]|uniref:Yip1 domain-containing protein n=1 Tax=bioreactor metagenome TaxID=1076179 RepID=A0A644UDM2_9ZZZZ|nr:Yip1 family protein [Negativicutes bacterium]
MGVLFETLYDVLFQPRAAMRQIAAEKKVGQALIVVLLSSIIPIWAVYFGLKTAGMHHAFGIIGILQIVGSLAVWVMGAALWHIIAELLNGKGTAVGLLSALGFAHLPRVFIVPLWVIAALLPAGAQALFMGITGVAIAGWVLYLDLAALQETYEISAVKAVLVIMAPPLVIFAAVLAIMVFMGTALLKLPGV